MTDKEAVLVRIGRHKRTRKNVIRLGLKWPSDRLNTVLSELVAEGRVSVTPVGVVRTLNLSEPAERVLNALPSNGDSRSGSILMQQLGMTAPDLGRARAELKRELLVRSTSGRGNGTLARVGLAESREEERLDLLQEEVRLATDVVPSRDVLEELFHACYIEPHEGAYPSYGAVVIEKGLDVDGVLAQHGFQIVGNSQNLKNLRPFADGMNSFVVRETESANARLLLTAEFRGLERDVVELSQLLQGSVIQRNRAGVVRLITAEHVSIRENGVWTKKSRTEDFIGDVRTALGGVDRVSVAHSLLSLCLHVLSPNHIGATLVWFTERDSVPQTGKNRVTGLGWSKAFQPPPLNVTEERHGPLILHSLAHLDRAAVINAHGEILWLGVNLDPSAEVNVEGGTRHNSAAAFSAEQPETLVFVVSSDGPVTVFQSGAVIRTTRR